MNYEKVKSLILPLRYMGDRVRLTFYVLKEIRKDLHSGLELIGKKTFDHLKEKSIAIGASVKRGPPRFARGMVNLAKGYLKRSYDIYIGTVNDKTKMEGYDVTGVYILNGYGSLFAACIWYQTVSPTVSSISAGLSAGLFLEPFAKYGLRRGKEYLNSKIDLAKQKMK